MIIFTGGNYVKTISEPRKFENRMLIDGCRWIKSKKKFSSNPATWNFDEAVILTDEEAKAQGLI